MPRHARSPHESEQQVVDAAHQMAACIGRLHLAPGTALESFAMLMAVLLSEQSEADVVRILDEFESRVVQFLDELAEEPVH